MGSCARLWRVAGEDGSGLSKWVAELVIGKHEQCDSSVCVERDWRHWWILTCWSDACNRHDCQSVLGFLLRLECMLRGWEDHWWIECQWTGFSRGYLALLRNETWGAGGREYSCVACGWRTVADDEVGSSMD